MAKEDKPASPVRLPAVAKQSLVVRSVWDATSKMLVFRLPSTRSHSSDELENCRFLELPAEIRNMIYEMVVVVGQVSFKNNSKSSTRQRKHERPQLDILRTCKQIHAEAESLYLTKNLFKHPSNFFTYQPFCDDLTHLSSALFEDALYKDGRCLFSRTGLRLIQNIALKFKQNQIEPHDPEEMWHCYNTRERSGFELQTAAERRDFAVDAQHDNAEETWLIMQEHLCKHKGEMEYVKIDFRSTFCPVGCCRPLTQCIDYWVVHLAPRSLNMKGLRDGEEERLAFDYADNYLREEDIHVSLDDLKTEYGLHCIKF